MGVCCMLFSPVIVDELEITRNLLQTKSTNLHDTLHWLQSTNSELIQLVIEYITMITWAPAKDRDLELESIQSVRASLEF